MNVCFDRFPQGRTKALTLSYDDGRIHDRKLVEIMNRYGIRGTFHLNSGFLGRDGYLTAREVRVLFAGHEVSVHTVSHPFLEQVPRDRVVSEVLDDRRALEELVGYPVRGMSYPFGTHSAAVRDLLPAVGIEYARTVHSTHSFGTPQDFLLWNPTCHHSDMGASVDRFAAVSTKYPRMTLFYVWGHSYEFDNDQSWGEFEGQCERLAGQPDVWYATNIEIFDYMRALGQLRFTAAQSAVYNPTALSLWVSVASDAVEIRAGETRRL